jgi:hypothetical protein
VKIFKIFEFFRLKKKRNPEFKYRKLAKKRTASARGRLLLVHEQASRANPGELCLLTARHTKEHTIAGVFNKKNRWYFD